MRLNKPKSFTIDRSKWVHGGDKNREKLGGTSLLNEEGNMCCLGFYAEACGVPKEELLDVSAPKALFYKDKLRIPYMTTKSGAYTNNSKVAHHLIIVNDSDNHKYEDISLHKKEKFIREGFKRVGVGVRFTGQYPEGVDS